MLLQENLQFQVLMQIIVYLKTKCLNKQKAKVIEKYKQIFMIDEPLKLEKIVAIWEKYRNFNLKTIS